MYHFSYTLYFILIATMLLNILVLLPNNPTFAPLWALFLLELYLLISALDFHIEMEYRNNTYRATLDNLRANLRKIDPNKFITIPSKDIK